jgi:hypothetical protein
MSLGLKTVETWKGKRGWGDDPELEVAIRPHACVFPLRELASGDAGLTSNNRPQGRRRTFGSQSATKSNVGN